MVAIRQQSGKIILTYKGRPALPDPATIMVEGPDAYSAEELDQLYDEAMRQRFWWRIRSAIYVTIIVIFCTWTFWLMPAMALRNWPFD